MNLGSNRNVCRDNKTLISSEVIAGNSTHLTNLPVLKDTCKEEPVMSESVDVYVGNRLRARRRFLSMSLNELGNKIGVRCQQVQKYETGKNRISASRLWDAASALEVPIEYFFHGLEITDAQEAQTPLMTNADVFCDSIELSRAMQVLTPQQKRKLQDLIASFAH